MYTRYYSGYEDSDFEECLPVPSDDNDEIVVSSELSVPSVQGFDDKVIGPLAIDDILLIGVFLLLLHEDCDDKLMLIVIGFLLLMGFVD